MVHSMLPTVSDTALVRALNPNADANLATSLVLIIDDDATARLALAAMLGSDGHRIAFATSASDVCSTRSTSCCFPLTIPATTTTSKFE